MGVNVQFYGAQSLSKAFPYVLILDSHDADREALASFLAETHFDVATAATLAHAEDIVAARPVDVLVVDPDLSDGDGMDLVQEMILRGALVFVTARDDDAAAAERAYARGATDFSAKPLSKNAWLARLRKSVADRDRLSPKGASSRLRLLRDDLVCLLDGKTYTLTPHECELLALLLDAEDHFASYEDVLAGIWPGNRFVDRQHVRVLVAQTRRKLERGEGKPLIRTVTGKGLKLSL